MPLFISVFLTQEKYKPIYFQPQTHVFLFFECVSSKLNNLVCSQVIIMLIMGTNLFGCQAFG